MLQEENNETKFIEGKDPKKIYISKRINHKAMHPQTGEEINIPLPSLEIQKKLVVEAEKEQQIINASRQLIGIYEQKISDVLSEI